MSYHLKVALINLTVCMTVGVVWLAIDPRERTWHIIPAMVFAFVFPYFFVKGFEDDSIKF